MNENDVIQIESGVLLAAADDRTVSGLLVPFGEEGRTNLGRFTAGPGVFSIPRDPSVVTLTDAHDRFSAGIGAATLLAEKADGIHATFRFAETDEGDKALAEFRAGTRKRLSVEAKDLVIRGGKALKGAIFGAGLVKEGAFPSAMLMAADVGEEVAGEGDAPDTEPKSTTEHSEDEYTDENGVTWTRKSDSTTKSVTAEGVTTFTTETTTEATAPASEPLLAARTEGTEMTLATVPNAAAAGQPVAPKTIGNTGLTLREVGQLLFASHSGQISAAELAEKMNGQSGAILFAALSDVKYDGTGGIGAAMGPAQWLGEAWSALTYTQQILPLFNHADLTAKTFNGFAWGTKPSGGDWAGNKGNVPSNTLTVTPTTGSALPYAIGHDIAREFLDFDTPGFFESYAVAVSEDYARWADGKVGAAVLAGATTLAGDALTTLPGVAGGTIGSAASAIIDGIAALSTQGTTATFALVATALWKQMVKMPQSNVMGYISATLGISDGSLDGFTLRPSSSITAGKVLVGARSAVTVLELPGSPVRIDALDLARGGLDKAAFGYLGVNINDARGLQLVTAAVA